MGIIGLGVIGGKFASAFNNLPNAKLIGIASRDIEKLINRTIIKDPSINLNKGNFIKEGISKELDKFNSIINYNNIDIWSKETPRQINPLLVTYTTNYNRELNYLNKTYYI